MCVFCVCLGVCIGRYCRSACSCRFSCKEHEPPGNAQKHQHWWHQHKSAKFTLLQIVAARSWTCRCQPVFTMMQSVYQNLKLLTFSISIPSWRYCVIRHSLICYLFVFLFEKSVFYVFFFLEGQIMNIYLSVVHSFCLTGGWTLTFSCYSTGLCQFFNWYNFTDLSVYLKEQVWEGVKSRTIILVWLFQSREINQWNEHEAILIPNWNVSATVLIVIHYSLFVKSLQRVKNLLQICCVIEIWIYMLNDFFLICM